jgi:dolichyl-phosphate-mannose--protein O-mannosyl transferase
MGDPDQNRTIRGKALYVFSVIPFFYLAFLFAFVAWADYIYDPTSTRITMLINLVIILIALAITQRAFDRAIKTD